MSLKPFRTLSFPNTKLSEEDAKRFVELLESSPLITETFKQAEIKNKLEENMSTLKEIVSLKHPIVLAGYILAGIDEGFFFRSASPTHQFSVQPIEKYSYLWNIISKTFEDKLNCDFVEMRIQKYEPADFVQVHIDDIHPGCDSFIMRLDSYGNSRLRVRNETVKEYTEDSRIAYLLPEGTPHEVMPGDTERYSLVAWCKQRACVIPDPQ